MLLGHTVYSMFNAAETRVCSYTTMETSLKNDLFSFKLKSNIFLRRPGFGSELFLNKKKHPDSLDSDSDVMKKK